MRTEQCGMEAITEAAKLYSSLGWHVVPVLGKVPQGGQAWQKKTTNDPTKIDGYFHAFDFDGLGVSLGPQSGIVDIECDSEEAEETLLILLNGELPNTPTFQSVRGKHFLFKWRDGLPNKAVFKLEGLEFRIGGNSAAQSVFPPSGQRTWIIEPIVAVIDFPAWDKVLAKIEANNHRKKFKPINGTPSPQYDDNETLDVPRWLRKHGRDIIGRNEGNDGTTRWFIECPGVDRHTTNDAIRDCCVTQELNGKLGGCCFHQSCGMNSWDALRDAIGPLEYSDYREEENQTPVDLSNFMVQKPIVEEVAKEKPADKQESPKFPVDCLEVPGLIGRIMEYNLRTALYPRPELALAGALALMSLITGRKVEDRWELRTNAYFVGLCNSGGGKSWAKTINNRILGTLGKQDMIMPKPKSGSGMVSSLRDSPASLLQVDELADWLEIMKNPQKSPHTFEILGIMKEVFSEATNEFWKPAGYADNKKNPTINAPHLTFYGVAPAEIFWQSLTKANLRDGLVGRLMAIESNSENESNDDRASEQPPIEILEEVTTWLNFAPGDGNLASINYRTAKIQHTEKAWKRYREHGKKSEKKRLGESEEATALWIRTPEKTGKLALLRACSRTCPKNVALPVIEEEDVEWAVRLSNWITRTMLARAGLYVAENQVESNLLRILRLLSEWRSKEWIGQKTRHLKPKERDEIIRGAVADEMIEIREVDTGKRKRTEFRSI